VNGSVSVALAAAAGLVGGGFTALPSYRLAVPAGEVILGDCAGCHHRLPDGWRGWLRAPSCCAACGTRLGPPSWLVATIAGGAAALLAVALGPIAVLPAFVGLAVLGVLLASIDLVSARLPRQLVTPAIWVGAAVLCVIALVTGQWGALLRSGLGALALGGLFLLLYLLPGRGLGFGDVRLAVLIGEFLGFLGWREILLGGILPWLINGPIVLVLLLARRVHRRDSLPFGPAMLAGALLAILFGNYFEALGRS
jgi:leader peptidase (prepilin peptidase) / N-methyltransferase